MSKEAQAMLFSIMPIPPKNGHITTGSQNRALVSHFSHRRSNSFFFHCDPRLVFPLAALLLDDVRRAHNQQG